MSKRRRLYTEGISTSLTTVTKNELDAEAEESGLSIAEIVRDMIEAEFPNPQTRALYQIFANAEEAEKLKAAGFDLKPIVE